MSSTCCLSVRSFVHNTHSRQNYEKGPSSEKPSAIHKRLRTPHQRRLFILMANEWDNSNKSPTRCNNFLVYYPGIYLQVNMFRAFSRPSSGARWLQWQPLVLPSYRGDSRALFVVGPARPRTQHGYHHDTKVKPEAATAVIELLMMGGKTLETRWAVNKRQDSKLKKIVSGWWFIWIVRWCTDLTKLKWMRQVEN